MGKRRANTDPPRRAKRKPAQSKQVTTMAPGSPEYDKAPQDEQGQRPSVRSNPDPPDAITASNPDTHTTQENADPDSHPEISLDDGKDMVEHSSQYDTHGSNESHLGLQRIFCPELVVPMSGWITHNERDIKEVCYPFLLRQWVYAHVVEDAVDNEWTIPPNEKQAVMDSLDGWCLYKDWGLLANNLPERLRAMMPQLLAEALINKDLTETIMKNPFFYMDLGGDVSGHVESLPLTLGSDLYRFWKKVLKVDRVEAHKWREQTVHLMNMAFLFQRPKDISAGERSFRLRRNIAKKLTKKMLDKSGPLYPLLLKDVDAEVKYLRFKQLLRIYLYAAENSVKFWVDELGYQFHSDIHEIGPYDNKSNLYSMESQTELTFAGNENGRRAVLLLAPLVWQLQFGIEPVPQEELDDDCVADPVDEDGHPNRVVCPWLVVLSKDVELQPGEGEH